MGEERLDAGCDGRNVRSLSTEGAGQEFEKPGGFRERRNSMVSVGAGGVVAVLVRVLGGG